MPKRPYTGNYRKRMSGTKKGGGAGSGDLNPPVQSDANEIAAPHKSQYKKAGKRGVHPNSKSEDRRY